MKKIGIVGGIAWQSTALLYERLCQRSEQRFADASRPGPTPMPEMCIESLDVSRSFALRGRPGDEASWQAYDAYFRQALQRLQASGAAFAVIASNTPHNRLPTIRAGLTLPVLSIFDTVARACAKAGIGHLLILGTEPTLQGEALVNTLAAHGVSGHKPASAEDRQDLFQLILDLQAGRTEGTDARLAGIASRALRARGLDDGEASVAVGLCCTELPLAFAAHRHDADFVSHGLQWLNTPIVHADACFAQALDDAPA